MKKSTRNSVAFWFLGLINNVSYVIMIAGAKEIDSGGVGLVYFFSIFPSLVVKLSGPYWFHFLSYSSRVVICALCMFFSLAIVALNKNSLSWQLLGVALTGLQSGLGEASFLALTSFYDSQRCLSYWSSGTGFAGPGGYLWVAFFHLKLDLSFKSTLLLGNVFTVGLLVCYFCLLDPVNGNEKQRLKHKTVTTESEKKEYLKLSCEESNETSFPPHSSNSCSSIEELSLPVEVPLKPKSVDLSHDTYTLTVKERFKLTLSLWKYVVPLFVVYFAEYTNQTGTWSAIGFPTNEESARKTFYEYAGMAYQIGVFVSRSSGTIYQASHRVLWVMPVLQVLLLGFFFIVASTKFWYDWSLLLPCFCVGLLGGAVYVNAFTMIAREAPVQLREVALSAASVGDTFGIIFADIAGLIMQGCIYSINDISGATIPLDCKST